MVLNFITKIHLNKIGESKSQATGKIISHIRALELMTHENIQQENLFSILRLQIDKGSPGGAVH